MNFSDFGMVRSLARRIRKDVSAKGRPLTDDELKEWVRECERHKSPATIEQVRNVMEEAAAAIAENTDAAKAAIDASQSSGSSSQFSSPSQPFVDTRPVLPTNRLRRLWPRTKIFAGPTWKAVLCILCLLGLIAAMIFAV